MTTSIGQVRILTRAQPHLNAVRVAQFHEVGIARQTIILRRHLDRPAENFGPAQKSFSILPRRKDFRLIHNITSRTIQDAAQLRACPHTY